MMDVDKKNWEELIRPSRIEVQHGTSLKIDTLETQFSFVLESHRLDTIKRVTSEKVRQKLLRASILLKEADELSTGILTEFAATKGQPKDFSTILISQEKRKRLAEFIQTYNFTIYTKKVSLESHLGMQNRIATIIAEPLERGFGTTLGNALRRILLSSLQGAAVTSVHIEGVLHEFSSIAGVREDVIDILLNIKEIAFAMYVDGPKRLSLRAKGPGTVRAGEIDQSSDIQVLNPGQIICTLDQGAEIRIEFNINTGKGYVPAEKNRPKDAPIGLMPMDAIYSPVRKVFYRVESTREGVVLDYDKLIMTVETNGTITPEDAVAYAARILQDQTSVFINFSEPIAHVLEERRAELPFNSTLLKKVEELELSVRTANCLKNEKIIYVGELIQKTDAEMLRTPNFGRKSLDEINGALARMGLHLGMKVPNWRAENIEELSKYVETHYVSE